VLGTTSPLFALVLVAGGYITGPRHLEEVALALGILASLGTIYLCARILDAAEVPQAVQWTFLALLAFLPSFVANSVSGMETPVVVFLMSLSLYLYTKNRLMALSLAGILLFLARFDTGFWLLALGIDIVYTTYRTKAWGSLVRPLALFCAGAGAWLAFAKMYFGSIVPQSIVGKAVSHGAFEVPDWRYVLTYLSAYVPAERLSVWGLLVVAVVFLIMAPSAVDLWRNYRQLRPIIYFFPMYAGAFLIVRAPLFSWYSIPGKWAFYLLAVYALRQLLVRAARLSGVGAADGSQEQRDQRFRCASRLPRTKSNAREQRIPGAHWIGQLPNGQLHLRFHGPGDAGDDAFEAALRRGVAYESGSRISRGCGDPIRLRPPRGALPE